MSLKCQFDKSLVITFSKENPLIMNGMETTYPYETAALKNVIESHFKKRSNDQLTLNYNNIFNIVHNQYVQVANVIQKTIEEDKDKEQIQFTCDVKKEILCTLCKNEWFVPQYSHINICEECTGCFFD